MRGHARIFARNKKGNNLVNQTCMPNPFLTAEQLAASLGVKPDTIRDWGRRGLIPRVKVSHKVVRYVLDDVVTVLKRRAADLIETDKLSRLENPNAQKCATP